MQFPKILVLLVNWNGKKDTLECLSSLEKALPSPSFATLVVDNGSTDDSVSAIRAAFPSIPLLETNENLGFAGGNNAGIRWALTKSFEWILLLNNDTVVAPDFLSGSMKAAKEKPSGKIFGLKTFCYRERDRLDHWGADWDPKSAQFLSFALGKTDDGSFNEMRRCDMVSGSALLMHSSVPETIGLLDERFFLLWEEADFCTRAKKAGFEIWTAPQGVLWHKGASSFVGGKPHQHYFWWRNRLLWISLHTSPQEKRRLYEKILLAEIARCAKYFVLKNIRNALARIVGRPTNPKARRYAAGCRGIVDYFLGRFGNSPSGLNRR
jgi:GT2 family glycosyltransferase